MGRNRGLFQLSVPMLLAPRIPFDTTNILFICGGTFVGPGANHCQDARARQFHVADYCQVFADVWLCRVKPDDLENGSA
jgi:ATP-dependent protease Clp ATPase subunit